MSSTRRGGFRWWAAGSALAVAACAAFALVYPRRADRPAAPAAPIQLRDVTDQTGIAWRHTDGSSGKRYIVETISAGMATFDYDVDQSVAI
ncbi:MAG: hypothetical protein NUV77_23735, partial [Thermoguttaceae bacterium]|nr:hypothetical protein [Thermoguttaceae bacterium]